MRGWLLALLTLVSLPASFALGYFAGQLCAFVLTRLGATPPTAGGIGAVPFIQIGLTGPLYFSAKLLEEDYRTHPERWKRQSADSIRREEKSWLIAMILLFFGLSVSSAVGFRDIGSLLAFPLSLPWCIEVFPKLVGRVRQFQYSAP